MGEGVLPYTVFVHILQSNLRQSIGYCISNECVWLLVAVAPKFFLGLSPLHAPPPIVYSLQY